ncbi:AzlC family ABC transporter permease [Paenibacillus sp. GCM10027627]|uniref:AzlC family ABC transporter permease n=1 Tax=unclassified Paenibacillus TaxID=185978 RepID=UPI0036406563
MARLQESAIPFRRGALDSIPILMGYIPACITFGLYGKALSLSNWEIFLLSAVVYAGASQFIGAKLLATSVAPPLILLLTFVINLRYFFISLSFLQKNSRFDRPWKRAITAFGLTEEVYAVSMMPSLEGGGYQTKVTFPYLLGLELPPYLITLLSTWAGIVLAEYIPESILPALNTSLYVLLIALIVPMIRGSRKNVVIVIVAALTSWLLSPYLGHATVLAAMLAGTWAGSLFNQKRAEGG